MNDSDGCTTMSIYLVPLKLGLVKILVNFMLHVFYHNKKNKNWLKTIPWVHIGASIQKFTYHFRELTPSQVHLLTH